LTFIFIGCPTIRFTIAVNILFFTTSPLGIELVRVTMQIDRPFSLLKGIDIKRIYLIVTLVRVVEVAEHLVLNSIGGDIANVPVRILKQPAMSVKGVSSNKCSPTTVDGALFDSYGLHMASKCIAR
jgi:hypothetical protein